MAMLLYVWSFIFLYLNTVGSLENYKALFIWLIFALLYLF